MSATLNYYFIGMKFIFFGENSLYVFHTLHSNYMHMYCWQLFSLSINIVMFKKYWLYKRIFVRGLQLLAQKGCAHT